MKKMFVSLLFLVSCFLTSGSAFAYVDVQGNVTVDSVTAIAGSNACVNPTATISSIVSATSGTFATEIISASGT